MTMQLFTFGHPCEHQLRRACIGGSSCPLHGFPDMWCCSFVKGKINFKRDKPCEGPRCRWGFTHPTQQQFDAVTQVLADGRAIATKIDESGDKDLLTFQMESSHVADTVHCALHMMKNPPSSCGRRIGQLLAYAALKAQDPKVFTQLLKTMKKPIDLYLLGAYDFLNNQKAPTSQSSGPVGATPAQPKKGPTGTSAVSAKEVVSKKDDVVEELRSDIVDVMNAALSQNGQLVVREDQHVLQSVFVSALRAFPKNKKKQEMLESALAKFKFPPPGSAPPPCHIETPELPPATASPPPKTKPEKASSSLEDSAKKPESVALPPQPVVPKRVVGISKVVLPIPIPPRRYNPLLPYEDSADTILGGLFGLTAKSKSLLGAASRITTQEDNSPQRLIPDAPAAAVSPAQPPVVTSATSTSAATIAQETAAVGSFSIFGSDPLHQVSSGGAFAPSTEKPFLFLEGALWGQ